MSMNKQILYIISFLCFLLFVSCTNEGDSSLDQMGSIRFSIVDDPEVEVETRSLPGIYDVNDFNVSLSRNGSPVFSTRKYREIAGKTFSRPAGPGYLVKAESCTEGEAERVNSGWGQPRLAAEETFEVKPVVPTEVELTCSMVNSSVEVGFSDYIKKNFSSYSIELYAVDNSNRSFTFDEYNHNYKTAYFNVSEGGRALQYIVSLALPGKESKPYLGTLTLEPASCYTYTVRLDNETQSKIVIGIVVDGTLVDEIPYSEVINPYDPITEEVSALSE